MNPSFTIRSAQPNEFSEIGKLIVEAYSHLDEFPKESDMPNYYKLMANVGELTHKPEAELLVAVSSEDKIVGAVVYFGDVQYYGSGGMATKEKNAAGFRLLAVSIGAQGQGIGKLLTQTCIQKSKDKKRAHLILHTTKAMQNAWRMYESLGFRRSADLDFVHDALEVFGFRMDLSA